MKNSKLPLYETAAIAVGEIITSLIVCGVYLIIKKFDLSVGLGVLLGSVVTIVNFIFLMLSTNRAIDKVMAERGEGEMSDEEAAEFAAKNQVRIQAAVKTSYIIRTLSIVATLVLAFLLDGVFDVIATLVPLLMFRPIITVSQLIKQRFSKS
ncbi:MAG: hypothetical protein E7612_08215 [Ruminococcaceae bacterium]|nr:hypothetical protein [Oscillospiraceae bacterium]